MTKRTYARTDGKDVYAHQNASIAYRRFSEPPVWTDEADQTDDFGVALGLLVLMATLGLFGWLFTIM
jgi:hypothetical protein